MASSPLRRALAVVSLAVPFAASGCGQDDSGTIDLKKTADRPASPSEKPREFRKGDLEER